MNSISLKVYNLSNTRLTDIEGLLKRHTNLSFSTVYPAGLYSVLSFFLPRQIDAQSFIRGGYKIVVSNGIKQVGEFWVEDETFTVRRDQRGTQINAIGAWGTYLKRRTADIRWADERIADGIWVWDETASAAERGDFDRNNRLQFTPKNVSWGNLGQARVWYKMPTGQTVERIDYSYDLQENSPTTEWRLVLQRSTDGTTWTTDTTIATASGTGSNTTTLGTAQQYVAFRFDNNSGGAQTSPGDGTEYGQLTDVVVYASLNNGTVATVNAYQVAREIRNNISELSAGEHLLDSALTFDLAPFITNNRENYASILERAASFGDTSQNPLGYGVRGSGLARDSKPILFLESQPALTAHTYEITLSEMGGADIRRNVGDVYNWISVSYTDKRGFQQAVTPDDDATLKDQTSIDRFGQRDYPLSLSNGGQAEAIAYGVRFLTKFKNPTYSVTAPISVQGMLRGKGGFYTPASEVQAGKVLRVTDYTDDLNTDGLSMLITGTTYQDDKKTVDLSIGVPDNLSVYLAQGSLPASSVARQFERF